MRPWCHHGGVLYRPTQNRHRPIANLYLFQKLIRLQTNTFKFKFRTNVKILTFRQTKTHWAHYVAAKTSLSSNCTINGKTDYAQQISGGRVTLMGVCLWYHWIGLGKTHPTSHRTSLMHVTHGSYRRTKYAQMSALRTWLFGVASTDNNVQSLYV